MTPDFGFNLAHASDVNHWVYITLTQMSPGASWWG